MQTFQFAQHLTTKNVFIAIVALNMLSAVPIGSLGGTFQDGGKPIVRMASQAVALPADNPAMVFHMVPGEVLSPSTEMSVLTPNKLTPVVPPRQKISSNPPSVSWIMLLTIGAMALYVRYLMGRAVRTAAGEVFNVAKQLASAVAGRTSGASAAGAGPSMKGQSTRKPATKNPLQQKTAQSRQNTIVRPSRWPFAA